MAALWQRSIGSFGVERHALECEEFLLHYQPKVNIAGAQLSEGQAEAFAKLPEQSGRDRHELLTEAVDLLLDKYHRKASRPKP